MEVRQISAAETIPIRHRVLRKNKAVETCYFTGDKDLNTFHLGVFFNAELAGICTLVKNNKEIHQDVFSHQLRGMAVLEEYQGSHIGKTLMEFLPEFLTSKGIFQIWCNARISAVSFYQKFGFTTHGFEFNIPDVGPHRLMYKIYG